MNEDKEFLGKEPVGRLLLKLALPAVTFTAALVAFQFRKVLKRILQENGVAVAIVGSDH